MTANLFEQFERAFPAPDRPFLKTPDGRRITYGEVASLSARTANVLKARGVKPGDRVAVQVAKSPEALLLYLACARAGAAYLPLNTAYTVAEVEYFVGDAEPAMLVVDPRARDEAAGMVERLGAASVVETLDAEGAGSLTDQARTADASFANVPQDEDDLAAILYTSGTTGRSKGAMLTIRNLVSNAKALRDTWRFTPDDVLLHALPIFHTHGLFVAVNVTLMAGGSLIFLPKLDVEAMIALLPEATSMMGVPTFYHRLLADGRLDRDLVRHIRLFVSGSAPLSPETHKEWFERTGHAILERYGMTETCMLTSNPYDGERRAGTVGFPLPRVELRIADPETGRDLPQGEVGGIEVRGPNVFKGYWRNPEKTKAEFRDDGFFITGDMGRIDERGYVAIVGRSKDLVISGGYNVYPAEVEEALDALPGVAESAVIGLPHADFGEAVTAVLAMKPGQSLDEAEVQAALKDRLARYKQPKRVLFVDELPRNTMGKIQKNELRGRYKDLYAT